MLVKEESAFLAERTARAKAWKRKASWIPQR